MWLLLVVSLYTTQPAPRFDLPVAGMPPKAWEIPRNLYGVKTKKKGK